MHFALTKASGYWTTLRPDDSLPTHLDCDSRLVSLGDEEWHCPNCDLTGGLLRATHGNSSSPYQQGVLEAVSWRLASELAMRHPDLRVYRIFPHENNSNVLMLAPSAYTYKKRGPVLYLNAIPGGRIHLIKRADEIEPEGGPWLWDEFLVENAAGPLLERIEYAAGLLQGAEDDERRPPEVLTYALIAQLAARTLFEEPLITDNAYTPSLSEPIWWEEMQRRAPELTQPRPGDLNGLPGYRFWRLERSDFGLTIETSTGTAWGGDFDPVEVEAMGYDEGEGNLLEQAWPLHMALELGAL